MLKVWALVPLRWARVLAASRSKTKSDVSFAVPEPHASAWPAPYLIPLEFMNTEVPTINWLLIV